jgi:hypothetical protein
MIRAFHQIRGIESRQKRWTGYVAYMCRMSNAYNILIGKYKLKKSLGRSGSKNINNVKMDLKQQSGEDGGSIFLWNVGNSTAKL